nr:hypothetical protein OlV1_gene175 [Ostreococcus lucimarinus virus 1]
MVKNLPSVERSTKIRFGKHVPDSNDQEENTVVFNASNVLVPTPYSNAVYLSPIRNRPDYTAPEVVLLMYDRNTKEITESGESANTLVGGVNLGLAVDRSNIASNCVQLIGGAFYDVSLVTDSNVGLSNFLPQHTLSVGSNLYIDDVGPNILVVSGNVSVLRDMTIEGNLTVNGETTIIYTENTSIKDALIELGKNNTSGDTTLDLGVLMHRPDALSNVVIGYREGTDEFAIAYTDAQPTDKTFTPKTDEDINVHVYGLTHVDANIYAHEDLIVTGNVYVSTNVNITEELTVSNNVYADKDLEVMGNVYADGNVIAYKDLLVTGNVYVSTNVDVTRELTVSGNVYADGNVVAYKDLLVTGNLYVSTNASITEELTVSGNVYADKDLEVMGNVYADGNVLAYKDLLVTGNVYANKDFKLAGNAYVTGNVNVAKQLSVTGNAYVSGNVEITKSLIVSANTHLKGPNVFITNTMNFLNPKTSITTLSTSNVGINLEQLRNVRSNNARVQQVIQYDGTNWSNSYLDQTLIKVKNTTAGALTKGQVVYVTNATGNELFNVALADASNPAKMPAIGVLYQNLAANEHGVAVSFGRANGVSGTSSFIEGETLYVSNTVPGGVSNIKPYYTDSVPNLIQNIGVLVNKSAGVVFVTGIGRANDIPNAVIETSNASVNYVYVNSVNNDLRKIDPMKLPTKLQPLSHVVNTGNTVANAVTLRGVSITSGDGFDGDLVVAGDVTVDSTTLKVNSTQHNVGIGTASPLSGSNLHVFGETTTISIDKAGSTASPEFSLYRDRTGSNGNYLGQIRFDGKHDGGNDQLFGKITGKIKTATQGAEYGIIETALVTNGSQVISLRHSGDLFQIKNGTDFEVGEVANLYVDTGTSRVGINTDTPAYSLDVHGTSNVGTFTAHNATISDSTEATSKSSGALQVVGGVGIQGALYGAAATLDGVTSITNATDATSKTDGALVVTGGVGVSGDIYTTQLITTGNVNIGSNVSVTGLADLNNKYLPMVNTNGYFVKSPVYVTPGGKYVISASEAEFLGNITLSGNTTIIASNSITIEDRIFGIGANNSTSGLDSGILIEHQDSGTYANIGLIHHADEHRFSIAYTQNTFTDNHIIHHQHDDGTLLEIDLIGNVLVQNNLTVYEGGTFGNRVGVKTAIPAYDLDVHGTSNVGTFTAHNATISDETTSTSKTTGALVVGGGVGISGPLYGAAATLDGVTSVTNATAATNKTSGALVVTGGVGISGDIHATHANLEDVEADSVNITDATTSTTTTSGALRVVGGMSTQEKLNVGGVAKVWDSTAATNKTSGALIVTGGVGVSGALYGAAATLDGVTSVTNATAATNKTSGALVVTGGVGISGALYGAAATLDGVTSVTNATAATNKTSGALVVTGGTGISGALYGAAASFDGVTSVTNATAATNKTSGALVVTGGVGISGDIHATHANFEDVEADSVTITDTTQATSTTTGALTVAGGLSTQTNVHAANVYISGGLITNTAGVTKKTYAYSGTIGNTEQPQINVCFTNESFSAKIDAQLIEGDDEISTISLVCCGGNKAGTFPASDIQTGSVQVFGPASTNPWSVAVVTDKTTVALKPSGAIDTTGEYHIFVEYTTAKSAGAVANVVQDTTEKIVFGY